MHDAIKRPIYNDDVWLGLIAMVVVLVLHIPNSDRARCESDGGVYNQAHERCINKTTS